MQAKAQAVMQFKGAATAGSHTGFRPWTACLGLLSALLALPFLVSGFLDLGEESLTDLLMGLGACWFAAHLLLKAFRPMRLRRARPALGMAAR